MEDSPSAHSRQGALPLAAYVPAMMMMVSEAVAQSSPIPVAHVMQAPAEVEAATELRPEAGVMSAVVITV